VTIPRALSLTLGAVLIAHAAIPAARGDSAVVGVNVVNPQRLSQAAREAVLDQLQAARVRAIRVSLAPAWGSDDYGPAIDFIEGAYRRGIKADLIVRLQYGADAQRRRAVPDLPDMWPSYPLSSADPTRFRAVFEPLFNQLEGIGITFAALELGNEINWTAFNGDFPVPGEGKVFGPEDLSRDPEARQVAAGYRAYLQILRVLKDVRDGSRLNKETPILSAGLSDPGPAGSRPGAKADAVAIGATLQYLRAKGIDALVDAYGVHTYAWGNFADRRNPLEQDALAECRPPGRGKPCWVTEWGLHASDTVCPGDDAPRAVLMREVLADLGQFVREGRLKGLIYYAWADDRYGLYRCGGLTESGRLALAAGVAG